MAVLAHPDDESICAGTLAGMAAAGHEVRLVCATRGEQGEVVDPGIDPSQYPKGPALGRLRETELRNACDALGIHEPIFLDFEDSGFPVHVGAERPLALVNQELRDVEAKLLDVIRVYAPELLITFDPHGLYGHADHLIIHHATSRAFWASGGSVSEPPKRLYYVVRTIDQVRELKMRYPGNVGSAIIPEIDGVSESSVAVTCNIKPFAQQKLACIRAHASQFGASRQVEAMLARHVGILEHERFALGGVRPPTDLPRPDGTTWL